MKSRFVCAALLLACDRPTPHAGMITTDNKDAIVPRGDVAGGRLGDFYLKNDLATFIIQRPVREVAIGPYGGSLIDAALTGHEDRFGELIPALAVGRTIRADIVRVISDGSDGEPAELEVQGHDALNGYYNLRGIEPSLIDSLRLFPKPAEEPLGIDIRIRYTLPKDEARLTITYTFTNSNDEYTGVPLAFLIDSRGTVESFMQGTGFESLITKSLDQDNIIQLLSMSPPTDQLLYFSDDQAMSIVPRRFGDKEPPRVMGSTVPQLGGGFGLEADNILDSIRDPAFFLEPGQTQELVIDVVLTEDPNQAMAYAWKLLKKPLAEVNGCVVDSLGNPTPKVRVGFMQGETVIGFAVTGDDGCYAGQLPPGEYTALAGAFYREPSLEQEVTVPGTWNFELQALGQLRLNISTFDDVHTRVATQEACRLTLVGNRPAYEHPALGVTPDDGVGGVNAGQLHSFTCDETMTLPPGRYLAFVTRGPEFDRLEQIIEVQPGETTVLSGSLHRAVDSSGYGGSDFHVHSVYSPDSSVPAEKRVLSLLTEGMDFWASTDHDVVADYEPLLKKLGVWGKIVTMPGAEVTTFDTGHFGAYPLPVDDRFSNFGSPDWSMRDDGHRPSFDELFDDIHSRGALVQVNHPRAGGLAVGAYFSRAGVRYDEGPEGEIADTSLQEVPNEALRFAGTSSYFSPNFDVIEVTNGVSTYVSGGMTFDRGHEAAGHDWMNFLSAGKRKVGVSNSDTHDLHQAPGVPRTYVGGHDGGVAGLVAAIRKGDVLMSTGPFMRISLSSGSHSAGMGDVLEPEGNDLVLHVHVETPSWYRVDKLEVIANAVFPDPEDQTPAVPAVPRITLEPQPVVRENGAVSLVADVDVPIDFSQAPFSSADSWLVVRIGGNSTPLYPFTPGGGTVDTSARTPETFLSNRSGSLPYAASNPIFVDGDGDGSWRGN